MKASPLLALLFLASTLAAAETPPPAGAAAPDTRQLVEALHFQKGSVTLADGLAKINLPDTYRYLSAADTETVLTKIWRNPRGSGTLGMIVPAGFDPRDDAAWAVIVTFAEDGYVKDDDAAKINYADLLKQMKEDVAAGSKERVKEGYAPIELVGWAAPPRYDPATHKLYWAKELKFGDSPEHTLNYNIRMLGRRGVLVLNAVASIPQLKEIEAATPTLLGMVDFAEGHRYADFNDNTDKVATYGLAALVAGGLAAKAGFFKVLWLGILAFKKVILFGLIALAGVLRKAWDGFRGRRAVAAADQTQPPPSA